MSAGTPVDPAAIRTLAIEANDRTWRLLAKSPRDEGDDLALVASAYASLHLWDLIGTDLHRARAHWLIARACIVAGDAARALGHAERCARFTAAALDSAKDFDRAYAMEGLARAYAANGRGYEAKAFREKAAALGSAIVDAEDQATFGGDFVAEPWFDSDS